MGHYIGRTAESGLLLLGEDQFRVADIGEVEQIAALAQAGAGFRGKPERDLARN